MTVHSGSPSPQKFALVTGAAAPRTRATVALALAPAVERVHTQDLDAEDRFDGIVDLGLGGVGVDDERVDVPVEQAVALLAHDRPDDDVAGILHWASSTAGRLALVNTTQSATSTS